MTPVRFQFPTVDALPSPRLSQWEQWLYTWEQIGMYEVMRKGGRRDRTSA